MDETTTSLKDLPSVLQGALADVYLFDRCDLVVFEQYAQYRQDEVLVDTVELDLVHQRQVRDLYLCSQIFLDRVFLLDEHFDLLVWLWLQTALRCA